MLTLQDDLSLAFNHANCRPQDFRRLRHFLTEQGTFDFPVHETGLFSAARLSPEANYTGYDNVWVRDNIHIAYAHYVTGRADVAVSCVMALAQFFEKHRHRFVAVIRGDSDPSDPMNRPHVRFNALTLNENPEKWSHAQNDALGGFLWLFCRLVNAGHIALQESDWSLLQLFPLFFRKIQFWQDEDSGHWEEARKIEASSIGAVVAGLSEFRKVLKGGIAGDSAIIAEVNDLLDRGQSALREILPMECAQLDPVKRRNYDSALLFLIYPLRVVEDDMADQIIRDVETHLLGEHGVRRYLGDSFWCADYKALQSRELRTIDVSSDMSARDALLQHGQEAQWCLFDPLLSVIFGHRYRTTHDHSCYEAQVHYLNRSLSQLTHQTDPFPDFRCPELYYLEGERYVPNDVTPLLWTQAHLISALNMMQKTAEIHDRTSAER